MNLRQIEAFRALMLSGTVQGAADLMNISQPAVSRLLMDLERSSGLALFDRARRRLRPRPEAHLFFREVQQAFAGLDRLRQKAHDIRAFGLGELRVATVPALAVGFIPQVCQAFLAENPDTTLNLQTHASPMVEDELVNDRCDIGISFVAMTRPGVIASLFAATAAVCVVPERHPLAARKLVRAADLAGERFVALGPDDRTRLQVDRIFAGAGVERVVNVEAQLATLVCGLVASGFGLSIVDPFTALDFVGRGLAVRRFEPPVAIELHLGVPSMRPRAQLADRFVATLERHRDQVLQRLGRALGGRGA